MSKVKYKLHILVSKVSHARIFLEQLLTHLPSESQKTTTPTKLSFILTCIIIVEFDPTFLQLLPSYVDNFLQLRTSIERLHVVFSNIYEESMDQ